MCPQLVHTYRAAAPVEPELEIRGRGGPNRHEVNAMLEDGSENSDNDLPPPLEPIDPSPRITARVSARPSRAFTIYRAQGTNTSSAAADVGSELLSGRRSRLGSRWSESESDDDATPTYQPAPGFSVPWSLTPLGNITCLEQYLVIVVDGERLFFRVSIRVERTSRGFQPSVSIDFMNYVPADRTFQSDVWLLFAAQLEATLLREVDRAFRRVGAHRMGNRF